MVTIKQKSRVEIQTLKKKSGGGEDWANHHGKSPTYKSRQKKKKIETVVRQNNQKTKEKTAVVNPQISIISLNVNRLNSPSTEWLDG